MKKLLLFTALLIAAVSAFGQNAQRMDARMVQSEITEINAAELLNDRENAVLRDVQPLSENVVFFEGFEGTTGTALPAGWETTGGWVTTGPIPLGEGVNFPPRTGNRGLFINWDNRPNFPWVFSRGIDMQAGVEYTIRFWFHAPGYATFLEDDDFKVQIGQSKAVTPGAAGQMPGAATVFTLVGRSVTGWEEVTFNFTPAASGAHYLGFHIMTPNEFGNRVFIDDVSVISSAPLLPSDFSLSVTGTHTFPSAMLGYGQQAAQRVTITNRGSQPTGELTVALSGANANAFEFGEGGGTDVGGIVGVWNVSGLFPPVWQTPPAGIEVGSTHTWTEEIIFLQQHPNVPEVGIYESYGFAYPGSMWQQGNNFYLIFGDDDGFFFWNDLQISEAGDGVFQRIIGRFTDNNQWSSISGSFPVDIELNDDGTANFADFTGDFGGTQRTVTDIGFGFFLANGNTFPNSLLGNIVWSDHQALAAIASASSARMEAKGMQAVSRHDLVTNESTMTYVHNAIATETAIERITSPVRVQPRNTGITIPSIAVGGTAEFNIRPVTGLAIGYYTATVTVSAGEISRYFDVSFRVTSDDIEVVSTNPQHNAVNVALDAPITITFNRAVTIGDWMGFSFTPGIVGATIDGDGTTVLTIGHNGLAPATTYTITLSAGTIVGLEEAITLSFTTGSGVGLPTNESADIRIFPNPVGNEMYIQTEQNITRIVVLDMQGRVVLQQQGNNRTVNMQSVAAGIYTVQIHTEAGVVPIRIVKK